MGLAGEVFSIPREDVVVPEIEGEREMPADVFVGHDLVSDPRQKAFARHAVLHISNLTVIPSARSATRAINCFAMR